MAALSSSLLLSLYLYCNNKQKNVCLCSSAPPPPGVSTDLVVDGGGLRTNWEEERGKKGQSTVFLR